MWSCAAFDEACGGSLSRVGAGKLLPGLFPEKGRGVWCLERLAEYDLQVIRFTNRQIDENFYGVCEYIDLVVKNILSAAEG